MKKIAIIVLALFIGFPHAWAKTEQETVNQGSIGPLKYERKPGTASAMLPDISVIGVLAGSGFRDDPGENGHNPSRTGFNLQEIELAIQSTIDVYAKADIFFSFHEEGVELEEGYLTTLKMPANLQIQAGKFKAPFGRFNATHLETSAFVNDPLVNNKIFGGEGFNELGVNLSWLAPTSFYFKVDGGFFQGDNENNFNGNRKSDFAYNGRAEASFDMSDTLTTLVGASGAFGFNDTGRGNATNVFGGDIKFKWRPETGKGIDWQTEYLYRMRELPGSNEKEGGLYTQLIGQWSKHWQGGARFDLLGMPKNNEKHWRVSPMLKYMPTEFLGLRLQGDVEDSDVMRTNYAGHLQLIFNMGPHGAHKF